MRVLIATTAGAGHFGPMIPFAAALAEAGHDVAVAAPESFATSVARAGFVHTPFADGSPDEVAAVFGRLAGASNDEGNAVVVAEVFGRIDAQAALPGLRAIVDRWRPDVILRDTAEFASYVVAEGAGIPHVAVASGLAAFENRFLPVLEQPLAELGSTGGVAGLRRAPRLSLLPESFEDPADTGSDTTLRFGAPRPDRVEDALPSWWADPEPPLVYVTFGSVAAGIGMFPGLYRQVVDALGDRPVRVLLTTGEVGDPAAIGPVPANVHIERWWPQDEVMPHAAAMVGHGGFGTTLAGLVAGVPQVVVPLFADQPHNARRVEAVGAGIALDGPGGVAEAIDSVLADDSYRTGARSVAAEIARLPPAADAVPYLESLVG